MQTTQEQPESPNLIVLSQDHETLRDEFRQDPAAVRRDPVEFVSRVDEFLRQLQCYATKARTTTAANAVRQIASEWQMIFTSDLRIPKNILGDFHLAFVPDICEPTLSESGSLPLRREAITERIRERAYLISKDWKVSWLRRLFFAFHAYPEQIHQSAVTLPSRTPMDDWHEACTCFACDVLDARIDLALQVSVDGFVFLESVWLEDVKRLRAFLHWEATNPDATMDDPNTHYEIACREIHERALDSTVKGGAESFLPIADWIRDLVLDDGQINTTTRPQSHSLVERKARRLWERTRCADACVNWSLAKRYVRDFYENFIAAVVDEDTAAVNTVLTAVSVAQGAQGSCEIVNALEAALITYFFKRESIELFYRDHIAFL